MALQLALDEANNDLIKPASGGVARVQDGRYTIQAVRSALQVRLGEWLLDADEGWLSVDDYTKQYDLYDIEDRARVIILGTKGVKEITSMSLTVAKRVLSLQFSANTIYGSIDLTVVPWSQ
jgi:hypothetical protein